jgi:hypothetical protein
MRRSHPACPNSGSRDHWVADDVLLKGNGKAEDDNDDDTDDEGYSE